MFDFDWNIVLENLILISIACLLAIPVDWDREQHARSAGLRTFPLVATGSCGFLLVAQTIFGYDTDPIARIRRASLLGLVLSVAAQLSKKAAAVKGTATAASIWVTGAVGVAVVYKRFEIALYLVY